MNASDRALQEAADWFALLRSGEASEADRSRWRAWLAASSENQAVWSRVEHLSGRLEPIASSPERHLAVDAFKVAHTRMIQRRRLLLGMVGMAGTGLLGWSSWRHSALPGIALTWLASHRTGTGEIRQVTLADGTQVWLASASAFDQDYQANLRRLDLLAGEILISTARDSEREFVVDTPQGRLRALGTRFAVRLGAESTCVSVYEGAVEVRTAAGSDTTVLQAGQQSRFTDSLTDTATIADPAREAWSKGILITRDTPLAEVASELNRYRRGHISVAAEIAHLPVFGSYPIDDPERTLAMLETVMPIRVRRPLPWWLVIEARAELSP